MKNLLVGFGFALFVAVGMSSCAAEVCYSCTMSSVSTCTIDVCGGNATASVTTTCNGAATASNLLYNTNDEHKSYLEGIGYTCTAK